MNTAEKLITAAQNEQTIKENEQRVYKAGKAKEHSEFWEIFFSRSSFAYAFQFWTDEIYKPPEGSVIRGSIRQAYQNSTITDTRIPIVASGDCLGGFASQTKLVTVKSIDLTNATDISQIFVGCSKLTEVEFVGTIPKSIGLKNSPNLTKKSLLSALDALEDKTGDTSGTTWKFDIGSDNAAKLTTEEKAIAQNKGWQVL